MEDGFARVKVSRHETFEHGHGRDERRTYLVCDVPDDLPDRARWGGPEADRRGDQRYGAWRQGMR